MKINENLLALAEKAERELVESGVFAGMGVIGLLLVVIIGAKMFGRH